MSANNALAVAGEFAGIGARTFARESAVRSVMRLLPCLSVCSVLLAWMDSAFADERTAGAAVKQRSVAECTSFEQRDREAGDGVDLTVTNACGIAVSCSVEWTLTCAPESKKHRVRTRSRQVFALEGSGTPAQTVPATAASCGDAGWQLTNIVWQCTPKRD